MPTISIIVPVYNVEKYLEEALQSLINQTYHDLQIICIDDGSTDSSPSLLQEHARKDSRIEIHTQKNKGLSGARNAGLTYVKGSLLMFFDPDDWIDRDTCEKAIQLMTEEDADLVMWGYSKEYGSHAEPVRVWSSHRVFSGTAMPILRRRILGLSPDEMAHPEWMDSLGTAWGKLYKSAIFLQNHIQYVDTAEIGSAEDVLANLQYLTYAQKAVYSPDIVYHYRKTNSSALTKTYKPHLVEQWQRLFVRMREWTTQYDSSAEAEVVLNNRITLAIIGLGLNELSAPVNQLKKLRRISAILHSGWYRDAASTFSLACLPLHWKLFFFCTKHSITIPAYLVLILIKNILNSR